MQTRFLVFVGLIGLIIVGALVAAPSILRQKQVQAAVEIFASPVQAGCYIAGPADCRIHVEPFTINLTSGEKMVRFQLIAIQGGSGTQTVVYDWRPDLSNPVPFSGSTFSPSPVAQDFAVSCGSSYSLWLQGMDSGDTSMFNLGGTSEFTCPSKMP